MIRSLVLLSRALVLLSHAKPVTFERRHVENPDCRSADYSERIFVDFSSLKAGQDAEQVLSDAGFYIDTSTIGAGDGPLARQHFIENVKTGNGELHLVTQAYSGCGPVKAAEIGSQQQFLYGSARAVLKSSPVSGVCAGHFYYFSDNQEVDIELLSRTALESSEFVPAGVWFTNQAKSEDVEATTTNDPYGFDPSQDFHEYRIDWEPNYTAFFIDGDERARFTDNVPDVASSYLLNNWSNGAQNWTGPPPTKDAILSVKSIELLYN